VAPEDKLRVKKQESQSGMSVGRIKGAMVKVTAHHHHLACADREEPILNLPIGSARGNVAEFKVVMTIHANGIASAQGEVAHINGEGGLKGVDMDTFGINLRFNYPHPIFPPSRGRGHGIHPLSGNKRLQAGEKRFAEASPPHSNIETIGL
jgi:hypothetical protein